MFDEMPFILSSQDLIDKAIRRSKKKKIMDRNALYQKKKTIIARTESFCTIIIDSLHRYVHRFPSIDRLPMFYQEMLQIYIDIDMLKKSLGAAQWAETTCQKIMMSQMKSLKKSKNLDFLKQKQKEIYGRFSSVVLQISENLDVLVETQKMIKTLPGIQDVPTIVLAGYPNVGKSSLLRCLSKATPEIAQYPFTTKEIHVGHMEKQEKFTVKRFQIIDTPGLLDRPFEQRNDIEKLAIAALAHLADVIVFLRDPSTTCGYSLENQQGLLNTLKKEFSGAEFIVIDCKNDLYKMGEDNHSLSCKTGEGVEELRSLLFSSYYPSDKYVEIDE